MKKIKIISLFVVGLVVNIAKAESPRPERKAWPLNILEISPFVEYQKFRDFPRAPIGMGLKINNAYVTNDELGKYFVENFYAYIPSPILVDTKSTHWQYPIGTQLVHFVRLKNKARTYFELRIIEKRNDGVWAFGEYLPTDKQWQLVDSETETKNIDIHYTTEDNIKAHLQMQTVPQQVCANCHRGTTTHDWPKDSPDAAGPCEMTPENPNLMTQWRKDFEKQMGWSPFQIQ